MKPSKLLSLLFGVIIATHVGFAQQGSPSAAEARFRPIIQQIEQALPNLADRGAGQFALARLYAQVGDRQKALTLLKESLASDEGFDPSGSDMLSPLRSDPEFARLAEAAHRRCPAVHLARVAFTVPDKDLFPEGLAYDPANHVFLMGSMYRRKIVRITERGNVSDFVDPDRYRLQPIGGVHVDMGDHSVWAASDPDESHPSELYHFDPQGNLLERYSPPGAGRHDLNDLVLYRASPQQPTSAIYVTDTDANLTYRFDTRTHEFTPLSLPRPQLFPNGITLSDDATRLYIADWLGVIMVELHSGNRTELSGSRSLHTQKDNAPMGTTAFHSNKTALSETSGANSDAATEVNPGAHNTLSGIDGLYWYKNSLIGVQSAGTYRAVRWFLSPNGQEVRSAKILERGTPLVAFPTTGAIRGTDFYFMANTGIDNYTEQGKIADPAKLEPVHIAVVSLR